jgi:hypothetical protein
MAGEVCTGMYSQALSQVLAAAGAVTYYLRLYSNNHTPVLDESPSNFTECSGSGYAAIGLVAGNWTVTDTAGDVAATYPQQTFTLTGALTIYGYYITDAGKTTVYWAELFAGGPITFGSGGGAFLLSLEVDGATS